MEIIILSKKFFPLHGVLNPSPSNKYFKSNTCGVDAEDRAVKLAFTRLLYRRR